jgi:hypothetical protein
MDYGVVMFPTEYGIAPDELARALEERGFESVWFPEHTHIPATRRSPWPGGAELPRDYRSAYDPFIALMTAATTTKHIKTCRRVGRLLRSKVVINEFLDPGREGEPRASEGRRTNGRSTAERGGLVECPASRGACCT